MKLMRVEKSLSTLLNRIFILGSFLLSSISILCQEDQKRQEGFGDYLFQLQQYEFASEEYERLFYNYPDSLAYLEKLITSYRYSGKPNLLKSRLKDMHFEDDAILDSYFKLLISNRYIEEAELLISTYSDQLQPAQKEELEFNLELANYKWHNAISLYNNSSGALLRYEDLIGQLENQSYKNPKKAALLSTLIPGAGRAYAKDIKDAIISFVFVAVTAIQSYQRFNKNGVSSIGGWIYGGIALGFHVSNIYGSYQSAKNYNNNIDESLYNQSLRYINSDLR